MAIKLLATEKLSTGEEILIKNTSAIGYTPVLPFFMKQFASLCEKGWAHPIFTINNNTKAIYAEINEQVVGHIVYNVLDDNLKTAWIYLSAVDENYRQRGIYKLMHENFETLVKGLGSRKISSYVHVNNTPRINGCASVGMLPYFYKMEKDL